MKQQHHKHCWASSHWANLRPQEREPWKEGGEEAHKPPEARAPEFSPQLSELGLAPTSLEVTEKARARHALGPRRWSLTGGKKILRNRNTCTLFPVLPLTLRVNFNKSIISSFLHYL